MRHILLALALITGISSAKASEGLEVEAGSTPYETLKNMFEKARAPLASEVMGYISGRCFYSNEPERAEAGLFVGKTMRIDDDRGPLFPGREIQVAFWYAPHGELYSENGAFYDKKKISELILNFDSPRELIRDLNEYYITLSKGKISRRVGFRFLDGHLIMKVNDRKENVEIQDGPYCYFFQRLKN